ncbi:MAG: PilZ domain-containing protein [Methyloceanibacter sp.]
MFRKKKQLIEESPAPELVERWKAIAAKPAPDFYEDGQRNARSPRSRVFRQAIATLEGGEKLAIAIKNLSASGCRIEFFRNTPLTQTLVIDEHSLSLHYEAEVVWQGEGAAGLRFIGVAPEDE